MSESPRLLTADDLAIRWQVPKDHVYRLGREGKLPTVRLGRYMRWTQEAIEAFERSGGTTLWTPQSTTTFPPSTRSAHVGL